MDRRDFLKSIAVLSSAGVIGLPVELLSRLPKYDLGQFIFEAKVGTGRLLDSLDNSSQLFKLHRSSIGLQKGRFVELGEVFEMNMDVQLPPYAPLTTINFTIPCARKPTCFNRWMNGVFR